MRIIKRYFFRVLSALAALVILMLIVMTATDYQPDEREILPVVGGTPEEIPAEGHEFTIVTWNLGYFGLGAGMDFFYDGGQRVRPQRDEYNEYERGGLDHIRSLDTVDFILFQEMDKNSKRSYRQDQYQKVHDILTGYSSTFALNYVVPFVPVPLTRPMGKVKGGIAVFSKYPPVGAYRGALPGQYHWPKKLAMLDRCYILSRFAVADGKELVIINTHNEAFDGGEMRDQQMRLLREIMFEENDKGNYVIAGGDWNMNPVGYAAGTFATGDTSRYIQPQIDPRFFRLKWNWAFDALVPSNRDVDQAYQRGMTPTTIIDFFVTSPNIEVLEVHTEDLHFRWSDHQPFTMRFRLLD